MDCLWVAGLWADRAIPGLRLRERTRAARRFGVMVVRLEPVVSAFRRNRSRAATRLEADPQDRVDLEEVRRAVVHIVLLVEEEWSHHCDWNAGWLEGAHDGIRELLGDDATHIGDAGIPGSTGGRTS